MTLQLKAQILIILSVLLVLVGLTMVNPWALAQEGEEEPTTTPTPAEEQTGISDEELESLKEEVKEKVTQRLQNIVFRKVALVGIIGELTEEALLIETATGKKTAAVGEETTFLDQRDGEKVIEINDLEIGQTVIAMGWRKADEEVVDTRRVVVISELEVVEKLVVPGTVTQLANKEQSLTLVHPISNQEWEIEMAKNGRVVSKEGDEIGETEWGEIEEGVRVIVAGTVEDEGSDGSGSNTEVKELEARLIYIYPLEPTPTPTPELSPTPEENEEVGEESVGGENEATEGE